VLEKTGRGVATATEDSLSATSLAATSLSATSLAVAEVIVSSVPEEHPASSRTPAAILATQTTSFDGFIEVFIRL
jgi:hypothetical protein